MSSPTGIQIKIQSEWEFLKSNGISFDITVTIVCMSPLRCEVDD